MNLTLISDVKVAVLLKEGGSIHVPVELSPYFQSMAQFDRSIYDHYRKVLHEVSGTPWDEMSYFSFMQCCEDIRRGGFIPMNPKIRFVDDICHDGHHRLAVLRYVYGPNLGLEIVNGEVQSLWVKSSK